MRTKLINKGTIWSVKSLNENCPRYLGMKNGSNMILILSCYRNIKDNITYISFVNIDKIKFDNRLYYEIKYKDSFLNIRYDIIEMGISECLDECLGSLDITTFNDIISFLKNIFNLNFIKINKYKYEIEGNKQIKEFENNCTQKLYKFGIEVFVAENKDVKINNKKQIILSPQAKEDIMFHTNNLKELDYISNKYKIMPIKAIKEIKSRLLYNYHKKQAKII